MREADRHKAMWNAALASGDKEEVTLVRQKIMREAFPLRPWYLDEEEGN